MQKKFKIQVDCANCAAKMETSVKKIDGVKDAAISFMSQKLMIDAEEEHFDSIMQEVVKACKKVEPDFEINL